MLPNFPMGLGTSFRPSPKGTGRNSPSRGLRHPPHQDWDRPGGGEVETPMTGLDDCHLKGKKIKEEKGGEDGRPQL